MGLGNASRAPCASHHQAGCASDVMKSALHKAVAEVANLFALLLKLSAVLLKLSAELLDSCHDVDQRDLTAQHCHCRLLIQPCSKAWASCEARAILKLPVVDSSLCHTKLLWCFQHLSAAAPLTCSAY